MEQVANVDLARLKRVRDWRIVLPVFLVSIIACIDRVNLAYAKLTMTADLPWITPEVFGMGAGIFFVGYLIFEIPGSLVASHFSATKWIARIMFTWGLVCIFMAFVTTEFQFFLCRFLLGASEASLYPVIYSVLFPRWFTAGERARATSLMLTSLLLSNIIGAPLAGVLLESSFFGMHGWQELFILEAIPALAFAVFFFFCVKDRPDRARLYCGCRARLGESACCGARQRFACECRPWCSQPAHGQSIGPSAIQCTCSRPRGDARCVPSWPWAVQRQRGRHGNATRLHRPAKRTEHGCGRCLGGATDPRRIPAGRIAAGQRAAPRGAQLNQRLGRAQGAREHGNRSFQHHQYKALGWQGC